MAKKKLSRKELLKGPDEFATFSEWVGKFSGTHQQQLKYAGIAIVVVIIGYFAVTSWTKSINEEGQNAYNAATQGLMETLTKPETDPAELEKTGSLFSKVLENQGMSKVARLALPQAAYVKFLEKDYSAAIGLYKEFLDEIGEDAPYESFTNLALAACYEAMGDLKTAIETLTPLVEADAGASSREAAMWALSRLYRLDNKPDKEQEILKKFVEEYKTSPFFAMAEAHLQKIPASE